MNHGTGGTYLYISINNFRFWLNYNWLFRKHKPLIFSVFVSITQNKSQSQRTLSVSQRTNRLWFNYHWFLWNTSAFIFSVFVSITHTQNKVKVNVPCQCLSGRIDFDSTIIDSFETQALLSSVFLFPLPTPRIKSKSTYRVSQRTNRFFHSPESKSKSVSVSVSQRTNRFWFNYHWLLGNTSAYNL